MIELVDVRKSFAGTGGANDLSVAEMSGMMLGDTVTRGKGYGLDTVMAVMRYAFDELGLERLDGDIIDYNEASHRLYVGKCGWREEGRQRRWHFREGRHWDKVIVGVTRQDYAELLAANHYWDPA